jgi:hypothetical protein
MVVSAIKVIRAVITKEITISWRYPADFVVTNPVIVTKKITAVGPGTAAIVAITLISTIRRGIVAV